MMQFCLQRGAHTSPFDEDGNWQGCAMEFGAYLAGLEHSDRPKCVSPVLLSLMVGFNDHMDDDTRQKLRPYIVRTLGTADDGQDQARGFMAADWAVRECASIALAAAGFNEQAQALQNLMPIVDAFSARDARTAAHAAANAASVARVARAARAADDAARDAARAADDAARDTARAAARAARAYAAYAASAAAAYAAYAASAAAAYAAGDTAAAYAAGDTAAAYAADTADTCADDAGGIWQSALGLLDRIIDPGGLHDVKTEEAWLASLARGG